MCVCVRERIRVCLCVFDKYYLHKHVLIYEF